MHIHILGICGTFMGSLALLAREMGFEVSGSDQGVYPPMSTQLEQQGIKLMEGYKAEHLKPAPDLVVIGNALSRGNPAVEYVLNEGLPYTSGPHFFADKILPGRWVLAAAGTHGKTTTASMLAWVLEYAGMKPGFLIGGVPLDFGLSARLGETPFFVVEADEYDSAFFDKRSKFVHYRPRTAILNNLEYDHADIFPNIEAIQTQFHHLVRTIPGNGLVIMPEYDEYLKEVLAKGCWSEVQTLDVENRSAQWQVQPKKDDSSHFDILQNGKVVGQVNWEHTGKHNMANALATIMAARHVGVMPEHACEALSRFQGVKRRMEVFGEANGITIYDDFAHHPTAIATTLEGLRARLGDASRILAVIEPRSNTMKMGCHQGKLGQSAAAATEVVWYQPETIAWSLEEEVLSSGTTSTVLTDTQKIIEYITRQSQPGDHVVVMSNGGFEGLHGRLLKVLQEQELA
ncbi:UDP-N-acetylmuramate:L-alanyl-gamma-D-glutamyl-meso-diaminopimelate ligase [Spongorhabdus nitratireducens]